MLPHDPWGGFFNERIREEAFVKKTFCLCLALLLACQTGFCALGSSPVVALSDMQTGEVLLTVSQITFSVVGESENIYVGSAPLEEVQWKSDDPGVVAVEGGVLTAKSVGTTKITATFGDKSAVCTAGCLAENREKLLCLGGDALQAPKRIPPETALEPELFFADAALIGDSVTCNLMVHETRTGLLGHPLFLARKNIGVFNFITHRINLYYQGTEYYVEDAIAASQVKKVFFLLGMNDLGYQTPEECAERYGTLIDRVKKKNPDVEIYIQTCLPRYSAKPFSPFNEDIDKFNELVAETAGQKGCHMIDLAAYIENHGNGMAKAYSLDDGAHLNYEGSVIWMNLLRAYAYERLLNDVSVKKSGSTWVQKS